MRFAFLKQLFPKGRLEQLRALINHAHSLYDLLWIIPKEHRLDLLEYVYPEDEKSRLYEMIREDLSLQGCIIESLPFERALNLFTQVYPEPDKRGLYRPGSVHMLSIALRSLPDNARIIYLNWLFGEGSLVHVRLC
jgi:hypothetical protein